MFRRYIAIHGPLLAKGLSFSGLFATLPLLFVVGVAGSIALTPEVRTVLQDQLFAVLPATTRDSLTAGLDRIADNPGSLSVVTVLVFLWSVQQLFFDLHRVVRAAFGLPVSPARGRLRALSVTGLFLVLMYGIALVNIASRLTIRYLPAPGALVRLATVGGSSLLLALVLWSLIRLASGVRLTPAGSITVAVLASAVWQLVSYLAGAAVRIAARRVIVYGVLASAVLLLMLMRVYAEIVLHSALWMHELTADEGDARTATD